MRGRPRALWLRYLDDLYVTPVGSVEREIADQVMDMAAQEEIHAYLDGLMQRHPESTRRHEIAWELHTLLTGRAA
ncbi:hypothetical protein [Nocardia sp. NPDC057440]|uniref:hypothetical protein n=1 Tax=Nocardia sp. NPDC057440 TaxID=3346134 RepID=UPI0036714BED